MGRGAFRRLILRAAAVVLWPAMGLAECAPGLVELRGDWGQAGFAVEIADDPAERSQGLMFRRTLADDAGMLFLYPEPGTRQFWMKNTLIELDMLFVTGEGRVQTVKDRAQPGDLTPVNGGPGVIAVLEIRGGLAGELGITPGSEMRYIGFDQAASLWRCDAPSE